MGESYVGARKEYALVKETTAGTAASLTAGSGEPYLSSSFLPIVDKIKDEPALGQIALTDNSSVIKNYSGGPIDFRVTKDLIPKILTMMFGKTADTNTGGNPYTLTWNSVLNTNAHQTYSVYCKDPIKGLLVYPGALAKEIDLDISTDKIPIAKVNFDAGQEAGGSGTITYPTNYEYPYFLPTQLTFSYASNLAGLASATAVAIQTIQFNCMKNTDLPFLLGQSNPDVPTNQRMTFGGTITAKYDKTLSTLFRDWANNDIKKAIRLSFSDGTYSFRIDLARVGFEKWKDSTDINKYMTNDINFYAEYDVVNAAFAQAQAILATNTF